MASFVFTNAKLLLSTGDLSFDGSESIYKLALMGSDFFEISDVASKTEWGDIKSTEIPTNDVTKYTSKTLNGVQSTPKNDGSCIISADNISYPISTISASYIVIVKSSVGSDDIIYDTDLLVTAIDIRIAGNPVTSNNGVFNINLSFSSGGFLIIK